MSCVGAKAELDRASTLLAERLAGFIRTLRDGTFTVGLREGQDAAAILAAGYGDRPDLLRSAFKHLFSARKADWDKFDGIFDAFWLGQRARSRVASSGTAADARNPSVKSMPKNSNAETPRGSIDQIASDGGVNAEERTGEGRGEGASRTEYLEEVDFRKLADPTDMAEAHAIAARLAHVMRTRLTRRDVARRRGYRLDLRRTIHRNISHGGVPIRLVKRNRKEKPLRLVILLDASGSMSLYTSAFLRFIHGVLDEFREAEAFLFHTRLAHVSDAMKEKNAGPRSRSPLGHGARCWRRNPHWRKFANLQPLACRSRHPFAHLRDDHLGRLRDG